MRRSATRCKLVELLFTAKAFSILKYTSKGGTRIQELGEGGAGAQKVLRNTGIWGYLYLSVLIALVPIIRDEVKRISQKTLKSPA